MNDLRLTEHIEHVRDVLLSDDTSGGTLNALFETVLRSAMQMSTAEEGAVLVVDDELAYLRIEIWEGPGVDLESRIIPLSSEKSVCAWTVTNAQPALVADISQDSRFLARSLSPVRSEMAVPVIGRGKPIGVVNLESFEMGHFTPEHLECIRDFCNAISHYWELASMLDWRVRVTRQHKELSRINEALLNGSPATLDAIVEALLTLVQAETADILLLDAEGSNLNIHAAWNIQDEHRGKPIPQGNGVVWRCMREAKTQIVPDVRKDPDYLDITKKKMGSMLAAPLMYQGEPIGVISMESEHLNQFSFEDARLLKLFAEQATMAVVNASLFSQYEAAQGLASLGNMTGNLAHRMNNIVGGIRVLSGFLAKDLANLSPKMAGRARRIESAAKDALDVVEQYERMFRLSEETIDLVQLVNQLSDRLAHPDGVQIVTKTPTSPIWLLTSPQLMTEMVSELIRNAIKSLGDSGTVEISVEKTVSAIKLTVSDTGKGVPEESRPHIFERGYKDRESATGMGFGLWWVYNFVKSRGGQATQKNREGGGAVFQVVFPKKRTI